MPSRLNPYVNFRNTARQAMEFYKGVFGGGLTMNTFGEFQSAQDPADKDKIMHAQLEAPNGFVLMGSDLPSGVPYNPGSNVTISLSGDNEAELSGFWKKLTVGGTITQPLEKAAWGDSFGMVTDKFGTHWMVNITGRRQ
jgi:PhnB protein